VFGILVNQFATVGYIRSPELFLPLHQFAYLITLEVLKTGVIGYPLFYAERLARGKQLQEDSWKGRGMNIE
jgi:hypothetical protein